MESHSTLPRRFWVNLFPSLLLVFFMLAACNLPSTVIPAAPSPTTQAAPTALPTQIEAAIMPTNTLEAIQATATPTLASPQMHKSGLDCVGEAAGGGRPPANVGDLSIQINLPDKGSSEVTALFRSFARPCDGIGVQGRFLPADWENLLDNLPSGLVFYSLPSLELAQQTADSWTTKADWFAYELVLRENTPASESSNPAEASRQAMEFAHAHNLAYMATPGRPVTQRFAADIAQYADAYGLQSYGELRESPETFVQFVKDTSQQIRAVKPDILFFVAFSTDQPDDDPQVTLDLIRQLLGHIDGVFLRTNGDPTSMEKLEKLIELLRGGTGQ